MGRRGDPGKSGKNGPKGYDGKDGIAGTKGPRGEKGVTGERGPKGVNGLSGRNGQNGRPGDRGYSGPRGDEGDPGQPGQPGISGLQGPPGEDGGYCPCPSRSGDVDTPVTYVLNRLPPEARFATSGPGTRAGRYPGDRDRATTPEYRRPQPATTRSFRRPPPNTTPRPEQTRYPIIQARHNRGGPGARAVVADKSGPDGSGDRIRPAGVPVTAIHRRAKPIIRGTRTV